MKTIESKNLKTIHICDCSRLVQGGRLGTCPECGYRGPHIQLKVTPAKYAGLKKSLTCYLRKNNKIIPVTKAVKAPSSPVITEETPPIREEPTDKELPEYARNVGKRVCYGALIESLPLLRSKRIKAVTLPGESDEFEKLLAARCLELNKEFSCTMVERNVGRYNKLQDMFCNLESFSVKNWRLDNGDVYDCSGKKEYKVDIPGTYVHTWAEDLNTFMNPNFVWLDLMSNLTKENLATIEKFFDSEQEQVLMAVTLGPHPGAQRKKLKGDAHTILQRKMKEHGWSSKCLWWGGYIGGEGKGAPMQFYLYIMDQKNKHS